MRNIRGFNVLRILAVTGMLVGLLGGLEQVRSAQAQAHVCVTNLNDSGAGSLRDSVTAAPPGTTIYFCVAGTITFATPISFNKDLTIDGDNKITLNGNGVTRLFVLGGFSSSGGITSWPTNIVLRGLTLTHGLSTANQAGGAITNYGTKLTVNNSSFIRNRGYYEAGAINSLAGTLTLTKVSFESNSAYTLAGAVYLGFGNSLKAQDTTFTANIAEHGNGGAIFINADSDVVLKRVQFVGNVTPGSGGAIANSGKNTDISNSRFANNRAGTYGGAIDTGSHMTISTSTFTNNAANSITPGLGEAGAILNHGYLAISRSTFDGNSAIAAGAIDTVGSGTLEVTDSTFSRNQATLGSGGALYVGSKASVLRSTFNDNSANGLPGDADTSGGAIFVGSSGYLVLGNATLAGNTAVANGGALAVREGFVAQLTNVTIANNTARLGSGIYGPAAISNSIVANNSGDNCAGGVTVSGPNLEFPGTGCGASISVDPRLGSLDTHGGPTQTMALLAGSPALDVANLSVCAAAPISSQDQRGHVRPNGKGCDLGAYERG